jgi:hypothetical protein
MITGKKEEKSISMYVHIYIHYIYIYIYSNQSAGRTFKTFLQRGINEDHEVGHPGHF